jgi:Ca2+/H+ antiporter, TMEM165/GDT1 family
MLDTENLGLLGVFIAGAVPWMEAIAVVPTGVILGLDPIATVIAAVLGNSITIFMFAYLGSTIRAKIVERRVAKGRSAESPKYEKALKAFDRYGIYGMAFLGPIIIGTQFAAAASVAAGVRPLRVSILITSSMILWASGIAAAMVVFDLSFKFI